MPHTRAVIHLSHLSHNMQVLEAVAGSTPLWPVIKANAYGHGASIVASHLVGLGYRTLCVAHPGEAVTLLESGLRSTFIVLTPDLPQDADYYVQHGLEAAVTTLEMAKALGTAARRQRRTAAIHIAVDTGMGRVGCYPDEVVSFVNACRSIDGVIVRGVMSHFPRADEADKVYSLTQLERFNQLRLKLGGLGGTYHMANSAALLALSGSRFNAVRPGIAIYGINPYQPGIVNAAAGRLQPVMELRSRVIFLKEVAAGTGLSYGHAYHTAGPALIATVPVGYGDGLHRSLSNRMHMLVHDVACPQVGRITMDQSLIDVSALRGRVNVGDEVVIIGRQGAAQLTADELAATLGTINYEIVTGIGARVPRIAIPDQGAP